MKKIAVIVALVAATVSLGAGRAAAISGCGGWFMYGSGDILGAQEYCTSVAGPGTEERVKVWCWNPNGASLIRYGAWVRANQFSTAYCPYGGALNFTVQTR